MKPSLVVLALACIAAAASCKRTNGAYCDDARPCPSGLACDLTARECHPLVAGGNDMAGVSTDMAGCTCSGPTPICVADSCVSCMSTSDPNSACAAVSPSTPYCGSDGSCVGCRDSNDCSGATPFCDMTTHMCRGCVADSECPSEICDLTPSSTTHGVCIDASQVIYADAVNGNDSNKGLTPTTATQHIQAAVNLAIKAPVHLYVHAATGTYSEYVAVTGPVNVTIVGADGATIKSTQGGKDGFGVQMGAAVTVRNMIISATMGNAANCSMNGVSFRAYRTQFINSSQSGVYSDTCELLLDGCTVAGNVQGGIVINKGDFTVLNSMIVKNSGGAGFTQLGGGGATTVFVNNTVADNSAVGTAGVQCATASTNLLVNTILYNNLGAGSVVNETNCTGTAIATDDPTAGPQSAVDLSKATGKMPGFVGGGDYHLLASSPCVDRGTNGSGAPNHDFDFEPRPDAKTMKVDIGADEVQQ